MTRAARALAACVLALALAGGGAGAALAAQAQRTLHLYGWAEEVDHAVLDAFTAETGIAVTYDSFDRPETADAQLSAGHTGYDLAIIPAEILPGLAARQALRPVDRGRIGPVATVELAEKLRPLDPSGLSVPYLWGPVGFGYAPEAVRQRLGERQVEGWDVLFRAEGAGRLKDCGIMLPDRAGDVFPAVLRAIGLPPDSRNAADYTKAADALLRVRPSVRRFNSADQGYALMSGDVCAAMAPSVAILHARELAGSAEGATEIAFAVPREGAPLWIDVFAIPADAPDPDAAQAFVAFLSRPDVAARNAASLGAASAVAAARPLMPAALRDDPAVYPRDDQMRRAFVVPAPDARLQAVIDRLWAKVKAAKAEGK